MKNNGSETRPQVPVALTIAGSDSGGGAGIQADLLTFAALGVFGTSAITCVTAQNPSSVTGIQPIDPEMVDRQIKAVCDGFPVSAAKTGMLYSSQIIKVVAADDVRQGIPILVVDPVMVAESGARLLKADAIDTLCADLLPQARVITPNLHEAEILCGHAISSLDEMRAAACEIGNRFDVACVVKGGHLPGDEVVDVLYDEGEEHLFKSARANVEKSHGAGCVFSAAITAYLAKGDLLKDAVGKAKEFVRQTLLHSRSVGHHHPLGFFWGSTPPSG
jgi:hydroxymethylpyrimidine kinase/phosphomethylpyrimidine kinase